MAQPLTVWHLSWEYPPHMTGGLGVAVKGLTDALKPLVQTRVFYSQASVSSYSAYDASNGSTPDLNLWIERLIAGEKLSAEGQWGEILNFTQEILAEQLPQCLIVHAHDWHGVLAAIVLWRRDRVPFVFHVHSTVFERNGGGGDSVISQLERLGLHESKEVITVSNCSKSIICDIGLRSSEEVSVVPNSSSGVLQKPREKGVQTLLFVGRFCSQKSPELMLEIYRRVRQRVSVRLLMVGNGEFMSDLRAIVEFCGLSSEVDFLSDIPHEKMNEVYAKADLLCLPSIAEPFGLVALEAVNSGLGVILSDRCGVSETLKSAPVVELRDIDAWGAQIIHYYENPRTYYKCIGDLQKEAASHTWQDAAEKVLEIYSEL